MFVARSNHEETKGRLLEDHIPGILTKKFELGKFPIFFEEPQ